MQWRGDHLSVSDLRFAHTFRFLCEGAMSNKQVFIQQPSFYPTSKLYDQASQRLKRPGKLCPTTDEVPNNASSSFSSAWKQDVGTELECKAATMQGHGLPYLHGSRLEFIQFSSSEKKPITSFFCRKATRDKSWSLWEAIEEGDIQSKYLLFSKQIIFP